MIVPISYCCLFILRAVARTQDWNSANRYLRWYPSVYAYMLTFTYLVRILFRRGIFGWELLKVEGLDLKLKLFED